jgi:RimJ/RimL family protein N-acetyltransferase
MTKEMVKPAAEAAQTSTDVYPRAPERLVIDDRFSLEAWTVDDAPEFFSVVQRSKDFIGRTQPELTEMSEADIAEGLAYSVERIAQGRLAGYKVVEATPQGPAIVGGLNLGGREGSSCTVAYWRSDSIAGQGVMSRAMETALDFAFNEWGIESIVAEIHPDNKPSIRLVERSGAELALGKAAQYPGEVVYEVKKP